jgi:hypothetical protein
VKELADKLAKGEIGTVSAILELIDQTEKLKNSVKELKKEVDTLKKKKSKS